MGSTSVRRNLFDQHQNINQRPTSTGPANNGSLSHGTSNPSTRPSHRTKPTASDSGSGSGSGSSTRSIKMAETKEIVVRDKNGGYKLDIPALPHALVGEDGEELAEETSGATGLDSSDLSRRDKEKLEAALVEMMIRHRNRQSSGEPDEILTIVHQSLRKKVASLEEDNWMFEPEKEARF